MNELVFEVTQESDGGYVAEALGESIFTQGNSWEELRENVREVVQAFFLIGRRRNPFGCISCGTKSLREAATRPQRTKPCSGADPRLGISRSPLRRQPHYPAD